MMRPYPTIHEVKGEEGTYYTLRWDIEVDLGSNVDETLKIRTESRAVDSQREFGLPRKNQKGEALPLLRWTSKDGLVGVVIDNGITGAFLRGIGQKNRNYHFRNVKTPQQALHIINVLSHYLSLMENGSIK